MLRFMRRALRRVNCKTCGVVVEELPWASGKHQLTKVYMQFLAHWARKLSWKETATSFRTSWEQVCHAVEYVVSWGLEHRTLAPIRAIGVDEIQYAKGHKYLTLVYQIDAGLTRLLWVGKERTVETFEGFFAMIGGDLTSQIEFVCSDMWKPYLRVIREKCSQALHILDRFHIVAKMNEALDDVRAAESRQMAQEGHEPLLKKSRWCVLKRKENLRKERPAGDVGGLAGRQALQCPGGAEQLLDGVVAEERREKAADRRFVSDCAGRARSDPGGDQTTVQVTWQARGQPQGDDGEEQAHGQHGGRVLEGVEHPGARAALLRRQAVHDSGLVGREEQPHAHREHEDQNSEPHIAEVDRQQLKQQEAGPGDN